MAITCSFVIFVYAMPKSALIICYLIGAFDALVSFELPQAKLTIISNLKALRHESLESFRMIYAVELFMLRLIKIIFEASTFSFPAFILASNDVTSSTVERTFIVKLRVSLLLSPFCRKYSSLE